MATIAELLVKVGIDSSTLESGALKAGLAAGVALTTGVIGAMNLESANDKLAAQLGANADEAERLGDVAGDLYAGAWGDSLEEVNSALRGVINNVGGMAEASDAELEKVTASVIDLGEAFDQDVGEVSRSVGKLIKTGLADDAGQALDLLTRGFQSGADEAGDLLDTVNEYSTLFREVGLTGQQSMGLISQGLDAGARDADKVADAIKEFSIRAKDGSDLTAEGFEAVGLNAEQMATAIAEGGPRATDALDATLDALRAMEDPVARDAAAVALFGTQAEDLGDALFALDPSSATNALGQVEGAAERMGTTLNDNANTNITSFIRQMKLGFVEIVGGQVLPIVNMLAAFLASTLGPVLMSLATLIGENVVPTIQAMLGFIRENSTVFMIVAGIIAAIFIPHLIALGVQALVTRTQVVASWIAQRVAAIGAAAVHSAQIAVMVARWVFLGAQSLIHAARVAAAWLIAMGPIGLVIAAVVALVALIIANWDKIWNAIKSGWEAVRRITSRVWNAVLDFLSGILRRIVSSVRSAITGARNFIANMLRNIRDIFVSGFNSVVSFASSLPGRIWGAIRAVVGNVVSVFRNVASGAFQAFRSGFQRVVNFVRQIPSWLASLFGNPLAVLWNVGQSIMQGLIDGISSMLGSVKNFLGDIGGWITSWKGPEDEDRKMMIPLGAAMMQGLMLGIDSGLPGLRRQLGDIGTEIESGIDVRTTPGIATPSGRQNEFVIRGDGTARSDFILEELREAIRRQGGDAQVVLGQS